MDKVGAYLTETEEWTAFASGDAIRFAFETAILPACESPIERLMALALYRAQVDRVDQPFLVGSYPSLGSYEDVRERAKFSFGSRGLFYFLQQKILKYRVDFVVIALPHPDAEPKPVIVECDGHDFHERTKEQAARDRSRDRELQAAGFPVLRFTGSEIWKSPEACAKQVTDFLRPHYVAEAKRLGVKFTDGE